MGLAGYATAVEMVHAVGEWSNIHKYALTVIAHVAIRATGGVELNLRLGRMIVFVLEPSRPAESASTNVNPASAFTLSKANIQDGEHVPQFRKLVSDTLGSRCIQGGFRGDSSGATPAGVVPVYCIVDGTTTPTMLQCPIYRPSCHPDDATDEQTVKFCLDINRMFFDFINNGVIVRAPDPPYNTTGSATDLWMRFQQW
ncbi:hypothetical protein V8D89_003685 [Ganoderma adspersum]